MPRPSAQRIGPSRRDRRPAGCPEGILARSQSAKLFTEPSGALTALSAVTSVQTVKPDAIPSRHSVEASNAGRTPGSRCSRHFQSLHAPAEIALASSRMNWLRWSSRSNCFTNLAIFNIPGSGAWRILLKLFTTRIDDVLDLNAPQSGRSWITLVLDPRCNWTTSYWPVAVCGRESTFTTGRLAEFHPPPRALIRETLAVMRRRRISTAARSSARAVLCAVVTSR